MGNAVIVHFPDWAHATCVITGSEVRLRLSYFVESRVSQPETRSSVASSLQLAPLIVRRKSRRHLSTSRAQYSAASWPPLLET
ncbi:hypothetical protein COCOBI_03-8810 [Coccomyxa sp. Obi]|nr:hypothetical protein COCOBI_03-8810 [Coccomyxa sp. Obi]